ncbi:hypothetical protein JW964_10625, partial [candidate division KSB1 bacterium]|nr:hypothetical protein [candidate division KSB1 bacterium]
YDYLCQKIIDSNKNIVLKGFSEINPQYFNDVAMQSSLVEQRINLLDSCIARAKIKEQIYNQGISRCNNLIEEVFPLLNKSIALLKNGIEQNSRSQKRVLSNASINNYPRNEVEVVNCNNNYVNYDLNVTLRESAEKLRQKKNEMDLWLNHIKSNVLLMSES